jgi:hypothetical protein
MEGNMLSKIFVPIKSLEDWKSLLARPDKHWKKGYSAKALASCWKEANDFPKSVKTVFKKSGMNIFKNIELLLAIPEYEVSLSGGLRPSQNDIFILARGNDQLISITVEGKVSEDFGKPIAKWKQEKDEKMNKEERLNFLKQELNLKERAIDHIRYQLLHRTVSAIIEAKRFNAKTALVLVHSFSPSYEHFEDYNQFLGLFGLAGEKDSLTGPVNINGVDLYFSWVRGEKEYLKK